MPATFDEVDLVAGPVAARRAVGDALALARGEMVNMLAVGDSRLTAQGGQGLVAGSALCMRLAEVYGFMPATPIVCAVNPQSVPRLGPIAVNFTGGTTSGIQTPAAGFLPNHTVSPSAPYRITTSGEALVLALDTRCRLAPGPLGGANLAQGSYMPEVLDFRAELAFANNASGGTGIAWAWFRKAISAGTNVSTTGATVVDAGGTVAIPGIQDASVGVRLTEIALSHYSTDPSTPYVLRVRGSGGSMEFMAGRFVAAGGPGPLENPIGIAPVQVAAGGYQATSFAASHASCGPTVQAFGSYGFALVYGIGANDAFAGAGVTAAAFKTNLLSSLIPWIRTVTGNPSLPIVLVHTQYRGNTLNGLSADVSAEWDQYAGAMLEAAEEDGNCVVLNVFRKLWGEGWRPENWLDRTGSGAPPTWDATAAYVVGDPVRRDGVDYVCTINAAAGEGPNSFSFGYKWRKIPGLPSDDIIHPHGPGARQIMDETIALLMTLEQYATGYDVGFAAAPSGGEELTLPKFNWYAPFRR